MRWIVAGVVLLAPLALLADDAVEIDRLCTSTLPEKRAEGARRLGKGGRTAVKRLIVMLKDRDWGVRMAAVEALGPIKTKPAQDAVFKQALFGEIRGIRTLAAQTAGKHDAEAAARRIGKGMKRFKKKKRLPSIEALGTIGGEEAIKALSGQMKAPDPQHREAAARSLSRLAAGEKALTGGLKDKEDAIRIVCAAALSKIDTDSAREAVLGLIERNRKPWDGYLLRRIGRHAAATNPTAWAAAISPRLAKSKQAIALLQIASEGRLAGCADAARALLKHRDVLVRCFAYRVTGFGRALTAEEVQPALEHKDARLNTAATEAWIAGLDTKTEADVPALRAVLGNKKGSVADVGIRHAVKHKRVMVLKELAAVAQGKTGAKKEWKTRVAAAVAMGRIAGKAAYDDLAAMVPAREWWLRGAALEGIYHTYDKRCIPLMINAVNDKNAVVRMTVRRNLKYLTKKHYAQKKFYENWWEKYGAKIELVEPDEFMRQAKKYGYATPKYVQDTLKGTDIVAVLGRWDKVQLILEDLAVPHQAIRQQQISDYGLNPKQIVLVNCEGSVDSEVTRYLQWFVSAGGYMATSDWALVNALDKTFPAVLKGWVKQSTGNDVVVVEAADPGSPILEGVFSDHVELKWWLEIQAFPIAIDDPVRAHVLVDSLEMLDRYGSSVMMAEFSAGLGKVMHSTSHFYLQKEGFSNQGSAEERRIFAADHLGISIEDIRKLDEKGAFDNVNDTKAISKSYSMFHMLVNFIEEKRAIDKR
ncbi:MAG: HEAT repeat domain-containing protein [Planctomycetota bacterium]|jgi:HEAT repeat protein